MVKKIYKYFSKSTNLAILNGVLIAILILVNTYFQAFCIPTTWTIIVTAICFTSIILYPILDKSKFAPLTSFINGVTLFVFIYCVIFCVFYEPISTSKATTILPTADDGLSAGRCHLFNHWLAIKVFNNSSYHQVPIPSSP